MLITDEKYTYKIQDKKQISGETEKLMHWFITQCTRYNVNPKSCYPDLVSYNVVDGIWISEWGIKEKCLI